MACISTTMKTRSPTLSNASTALGTEPPTCRRWADIADLSDEESADTTEALTPTGASRGLTSSTSTPSPEPYDSRLPASAELTNCTRSRTLSADAPDFVPCLTMVCPLVGVCCVVPESSGQLPMGPVPVLAAAVPVPLAPLPAGCREAAGEAPARAAPAPPAAAEPRKPPAGRKPRPAAVQTASSQRRRQSTGPVGSAQGEMPEATEEEWQHRVGMRQRSVALGKATAAYHWYGSLKAPEEREDGEPVTPDPTDRSVSKRHWKYLVQRWRNALHLMYVEDGNGSTLSADDGRSTVTATTEMGERSFLAIDGDDTSSSS